LVTTRFEFLELRLDELLLLVERDVPRYGG
jgi:hypothetical protein